ncbi:MAG: hypothetical protein OEY14_16645 [Myxococcales bacterium]|nr:hypothetical protein [Myxococcales bacterium]
MSARLVSIGLPALCALLACGEAAAPAEPRAAEPTAAEPTAAEPAAAEPAGDGAAGDGAAGAPGGDRALRPAPEPEERAAEPPPLPPFLLTTVPQDELLRRLAETPSRQFKPVGSTSVVFRLRLRAGDDLMAAYKPQSRQHRQGHKAELAAYRISRLLGMDNVPPAAFRRVEIGEMERRLNNRYVDAWGEIRSWTIWDEADQTDGAAIYWIPQMRDLGLDQEGRIRRWVSWLSQEGELPGDREVLAADLSKMLLFDYLIGNWDRFSGGNLMGTPAGDRVYVRDHNVAFAEPLPEHLHERLLFRMTRVERFSRPFVQALQRLTPRMIAAEFAKVPLHLREPLLTEAQLAALLERRETILSHVGAVVAEFGLEATMVFP